MKDTNIRQTITRNLNEITLTSDNAAVCFGKVVGLAQFPK